MWLCFGSVETFKQNVSVAWDKCKMVKNKAEGNAAKITFSFYYTDLF